MLKIGLAFEFEVPDGWMEFTKGNSHVFQGPNTEELIVSGTRIEGVGSDAELEAIRHRILQNALESVKQAASHPELEVTRSLERDEKVRHLEYWSLTSQTADRGTLFLESVFLAERGLLLVTFEAPNTITSTALYDRFIQSVRSLPL